MLQRLGEDSLSLPTGLGQDLMARGLPDGPIRPPGFDPQIYASVPLFNRRVDLIALLVSFLVIAISGLNHVVSPSIPR